MSNYTQLTRNPDTGKMEQAEWLDNHFGHHEYGVRFPSGKVFKASKVLKESDYKWGVWKEKP